MELMFVSINDQMMQTLMHNSSGTYPIVFTTFNVILFKTINLFSSPRPVCLVALHTRPTMYINTNGYRRNSGVHVSMRWHMWKLNLRVWVVLKIDSLKVHLQQIKAHNSGWTDWINYYVFIQLWLQV